MSPYQPAPVQLPGHYQAQLVQHCSELTAAVGECDRLRQCGFDVSERESTCRRLLAQCRAIHDHFFGPNRQSNPGLPPP